MQSCPVCTGKLLRHIQSGSIYWFCRHCWQAMPTLTSNARHAEMARSHSSSNKGLSKAIASNQIQQITGISDESTSTTFNSITLVG